MLPGHGFTPTWSDSTAMVDFSKPVGCDLFSCQLTILPTIGGEHLVGYSALNLPALLPDGAWAKPDSDLLYAEPYFFPRNSLVEFTPNIYIAANPLQLSLFSVPMQPHTPEPLIYNLGHFYFLTCFVTITYYDYTSNSDLPLDSSNNCTLLSHPMNITYLNDTQYSSFIERTSLYFHPSVPIQFSISLKHYTNPFPLITPFLS